MPVPKEFTIDKVAWHTRTPGNPETTAMVRRRFWHLAHFLDENGLSVCKLAIPEDQIADEFEIRTTDLTAEGLALMKVAYDRWLKKYNRSCDPTNVGILRTALEKLRAANRQT